MAQHNLEAYVTSRYLQDCNNVGYQPMCQNTDEMLEDALKILDSLNRANQVIKSALQNRRITPA